MGKNIFQKNAISGETERKFVMVIDLAKCKNARKCVESCQKAHHLPPNQELMKVYLMQESEEAAPYWMPKPCFHCDHPLCVEACPEGATIKRPDGIVVIDKVKCKGCKLCLKVCPYSSRQFSKSDHTSHHPTASLEKNLYDKESGVNKCDFCADLLMEGKSPHCVSACPNGAIYFGDQIENFVSNGIESFSFSELIATQGGYRHLEDLGTKPNVFYLPPGFNPIQ
jgi:Fe-S-cluster-containing dehydrogenase component